MLFFLEFFKECIYRFFGDYSPLYNWLETFNIPKVDKQLSIISVNRGGTNTRGSSRVVQESCEFRAQPARPESVPSVPSNFPTGIRHHTPAVVYATTRLMMT